MDRKLNFARLYGAGPNTLARLAAYAAKDAELTTRRTYVTEADMKDTQITKDVVKDVK